MAGYQPLDAVIEQVQDPNEQGGNNSEQLRDGGVGGLNGKEGVNTVHRLVYFVPSSRP